VFIYTTCRACGDTLTSTNNDTVHPLCPPRPTKVERLTTEWLDAAHAGDEQRATDLQVMIDELDARPPQLLRSALTYARWGWPVFPLRARSKQPATRNGFKNATTDEDRIRAWWAQHPDANIGLPTGIMFDVIDIDVPHGPPSLAHILESTVDHRTGRGLLPDAHGVCATASGGAHYYIRAQGGGNKTRIMPGIDTRGAGGYVVAPPSTLGERGRSWSWTVAPSPAIKAGMVTA